MADTGRRCARTTATGSAPPLRASSTCTAPSASATATRSCTSLSRPAKHTCPGANPSLIMVTMSKLTTSNNFSALSPATVAQYRPLGLTARDATGDRCARKCFTNSTPRACFFQSLMCPSWLADMKKPERAAATSVT